MIFVISCTNNPKTTTNTSSVKEKKEDVKNDRLNFEVDTDNTIINWMGKKTTGSHNGNIKIQQGVISKDSDGNLLAGKFVFDMESIECSDLTGSKKESIEGHLKDGDFFDTKKHPTASFVIKKIDNGNIYGILTIKGISHEITFPYIKLNEHEYKAKIIVDRTLFDIKYKSKSIFPELADHFIYDDFTITLNPLAIVK